VTDSTDEVLSRSDIDSVIILHSTDTHAALIEAAAEAGKAIFCEKPVALELGRTQKALAKVAEKVGSIPNRVSSAALTQGTRRLSVALKRVSSGDWINFALSAGTQVRRQWEYLEKCGGLFFGSSDP